MYDYEYYFEEPSEADIILEEAKQKMKEVLNNDIKQKIEFLEDENKRLTNELEKYIEQVKDIHNKERDLESKEINLERDIIRRKFSKLLEPIIEIKNYYRIGYRYVDRKKCNKCNTNREIVYTSEHGDKITKPCRCSEQKVEYFPDNITLQTISFYKNGKEIKCTPIFESKDYDDTYCKLEFKRFIDKYDGGISSLDDYTLRYNSVWTNKEECQKYCNILNKKKNKI